MSLAPGSCFVALCFQQAYRHEWMYMQDCTGQVTESGEYCEEFKRKMHHMECYCCGVWVSACSCTCRIPIPVGELSTEFARCRRQSSQTSFKQVSGFFSCSCGCSRSLHALDPPQRITSANARDVMVVVEDAPESMKHLLFLSSHRQRCRICRTAALRHASHTLPICRL